jgi:hypothetical protein
VLGIQLSNDSAPVVVSHVAVPKVVQKQMSHHKGKNGYADAPQGQGETQEELPPIAETAYLRIVNSLMVLSLPWMQSVGQCEKVCRRLYSVVD